MMPFLTWFENDRVTEDGFDYRMWFLVHESGRVVATIDGPTFSRHRQVSFCYTATSDAKQERLYIHLEGAKEWCEQQARTILTDELRQRALKRKQGDASKTSRRRSEGVCHGRADNKV